MLPRERFFRHVDVILQDDSCWLWLGTRNRRSGYGRFRLNGRLLAAHRVAWEFEFDPIPDGMNVLHRCDNPPCVRPSHLFLGTQQDNVDDMVAKGRDHFDAFIREAQKIHVRQQRSASACRQGHKYTVANTRIQGGRRRCRACAAAGERERRRARKA